MIEFVPKSTHEKKRYENLFILSIRMVLIKVMIIEILKLNDSYFLNSIIIIIKINWQKMSVINSWECNDYFQSEH